MSSIFVATPPASEASPLCLGIVLPDNQVTSVSRGTGFINGDPSRPVEWTAFREFDGRGPNDPTELIAVDGFALEQFSVSTGVPAKAMIVSKENGPTCTTDAMLTLNCETIFDLATYQAAMWLSAVGDIRFDGFMGHFDRDIHLESRQRVLSEGDLIRYAVSGRSDVVGVVELLQHDKGRRWAARLHSCGSPSGIRPNDILYSQAQSTFEGITANFECELAVVQSVH